MNQTIRQIRKTIKQLQRTAPTPECRMHAQRAMIRMKCALHSPDCQSCRNRLTYYAEVLCSLSGYASACELGIEQYDHLGLNCEDANLLHSFYRTLAIQLEDLARFLNAARGEPEPYVYITAPKHIGDDEGSWQALFRAVDLWKIKAHFYKKACEEKGGMKTLCLLAFQWLETAVTCPRGSESDPAHWLTNIIAEHITPQYRHYHNRKDRTQLRISARVARMIIEEVTKTLRIEWLKVNRPDLLN